MAAVAQTIGQLNDIECNQIMNLLVSLDKNIILPSEVLKGKSYLDWITLVYLYYEQTMESLATWNVLQKEDIN